MSAFIRDLYDYIVNLITPVKRSIKEINTWRKFQHREHEAVQEHILRIVDFLDDDKNNTGAELDSIVAFKDFDGPGKHLIVEGNHRVFAVNESKNANELYVKFVEKKYWKDLTDLDIHELSLLFNKLDLKPKLQMNKMDGLKFIFKYMSQNSDLTLLEEKLLSFNYSKREVSSLMKKARDILDQNRYLGALANDMVWINWKKDGALQTEVEKLKASGVYVMSMSSANFNYEKLIFALAKENIKQLYAVVHHPHHPAYVEWYKTDKKGNEIGWKSKHSKVLKTLGEKFGFMWDWHELPHIKPNKVK